MMGHLPHFACIRGSLVEIAYCTQMRVICLMYVLILVCMYLCMHAYMHGCMYTCMYVIGNRECRARGSPTFLACACMCACTHVHMHARMHACIYVCIYIYVCMHVRTYVCANERQSCASKTIEQTWQTEQTPTKTEPTENMILPLFGKWTMHFAILCCKFVAQSCAAVFASQSLQCCSCCMQFNLFVLAWFVFWLCNFRNKHIISLERSCLCARVRMSVCARVWMLLCEACAGLVRQELISGLWSNISVFLTNTH